jgi:hypothetical protein
MQFNGFEVYPCGNAVLSAANGVLEDPIPFDFEINGAVYTITEYGYKYDVSLPPELIGCPSIESHAIGEQITGVNLSSFTITSIQAL